MRFRHVALPEAKGDSELLECARSDGFECWNWGVGVGSHVDATYRVLADVLRCMGRSGWARRII